MKKYLIIGIVLIAIIAITVITFSILNSKTVGPCGPGKLSCAPDYLIFKTVDINYSNYNWGKISNFPNKYASEISFGRLDEELVPLHKGYYMHLDLAENVDKIAFYDKSFHDIDWAIPLDENLRKEREKLIINNPFTELCILSPEYLNIYSLKESGLHKEAIQEAIRDKINKMIDEGTLDKNCDKKI